MKGSVDIAKGRVEEAAGALVNDDKLRDKGRTDQAIGRVKQVAEDSVQQVREEARMLVDKAKDVAKKVVEKAQGGV